MHPIILRKRIRILLAVFVGGLVISGLTALPLNYEVNLLYSFAGPNSALQRIWPAMAEWLATVHRGLNEMTIRHPFLFYGTDWLAFAHIVIAVAFIGPIRDPVKNSWVIDFGIIACMMIFPMVAIFAPIRGIPFFWAVIDCSFGAIGLLPLWGARVYTKRLIEIEKSTINAG